MPLSSLHKQKPATKYIPYTLPLDEYTCGTVDWDVTRTIQLGGVPFETMSNATLNELSRQLFSTLNNIGARNTRVALWTHLIRRKIKYDLSSIEYDNYFSQELNRQYAARVGDEDFYTNELFISPVYRTAPSAAERYALRFSRDKAQKRGAHATAVEEMDKLTRQMLRSLRRYHPTMLGTTETEDGMLNAEYAELYGRILNGGHAAPVAVNHYAVGQAIQRSTINFDGDVVVIHRPDSTRYAGILTLKAPYSVETMSSKLLHGLLHINAEFILSQSLTFLTATKAERFLEIQLNQIETTSNNELQIKELKTAIALLQNGKFGMGEHEFTLTIYGDTIQELNDSIAEAMSVFESKSLEVYRETHGGLIAQYFGMLPGNFTTKRIRAQPISTDNFVSLFPMHNYVTGNSHGSQWGMPIAMLKTAGGSPYFLNYHVSRQALKEQGLNLEYDPDDAVTDDVVAAPVAAPVPASAHVEDDHDDPKAPVGVSKNKRQRKESGNHLFIGPNGSGKTAAQCFLRAMARKKYTAGARRGRKHLSFTFDKDGGQEIFILALGGRYFRFVKGEPTGINLFWLPDNPRSHHFILTMAKWCASVDKTYVLSSTDEKDLLEAIREVYSLPLHMRKWSRISDTLKAGSPLAVALSRYFAGGAYAWVFDSDEDKFDLSVASDFGFDMTEFLDDDMARTPILRALKYKIDLHAPGSSYSIDIDEASHALKDPLLRDEYIELEARTIRKKDGILGLGLQDASDACKGPLEGLLTTQFPTLFIFPNGQADRKWYVDGLKLTEAEFEQVRIGMNDKPGSFLLKRGIESAVVQVDLSGMDDMLSVLSGSADNLPLVRDLVAQYGATPHEWLPEFFKRRS
jgi:type IV secretion system protein VirB4